MGKEVSLYLTLHHHISFDLSATSSIDESLLHTIPGPLPVKPIASKAVPKPMPKKEPKSLQQPTRTLKSLVLGSEQTVGKHALRSRAAKDQA
jgi:hypothetical protein